VPEADVNEEMVRTVLWVVAIASSALFLLRMAAMVFIGGDHGTGAADSDPGVDMGANMDHDHFGHDASGDLKLVSVYTIIAFFMMGSWGALSANSPAFGLEIGPSIGVGGGIGFLFMWVVAWMLAKTRTLEQDGTLRNFDPRGLRGECYVTVPPAGKGEGQVRVVVKGREKIFRAVNEEDAAIDSFRPILVTGMTPDRVMRVRKFT
jgi:hypothetical protein